MQALDPEMGAHSGCYLVRWRRKLGVMLVRSPAEAGLSDAAGGASGLLAVHATPAELPACDSATRRTIWLQGSGPPRGLPELAPAEREGAAGPPLDSSTSLAPGLPWLASASSAALCSPGSLGLPSGVPRPKPREAGRLGADEADGGRGILPDGAWARGPLRACPADAP